MRFLRIVARSSLDFFRDGGMMLAGALSYFSMMAIVPFCILLVTIFGYFLGEGKAFYQFFSVRLMSYFPEVTHEITEQLGKIITYKDLGKFSLILYGILSYEFFSSLETATNVIFKVKAKRSFIVSTVLSLVVVTSIMAFFLISFAATSTVAVLSPIQELFPALRIGKITAFFVRFLIPFVLTSVIVATLYVLLPKRRVTLANAFSGALFTAVLLEAAKHLFTFYIHNVFKLGAVYGPLSALVISLLWTYYSSCVFLIGAEVVHNLEVSKRKTR